MQYILAIDQGTTSTRAMIFDEDLGLVAQALIATAVIAIASSRNRAGIFINNLPRQVGDGFK